MISQTTEELKKESHNYTFEEAHYVNYIMASLARLFLKTFYTFTFRLRIFASNKKEGLTRKKIESLNCYWSLFFLFSFEETIKNYQKFFWLPRLGRFRDGGKLIIVWNLRWRIKKELLIRLFGSITFSLSLSLVVVVMCEQNQNGIHLRLFYGSSTASFFLFL